MSAAEIRLEGVSVHYGARCAVRDVTLAIPAGTITALIGPSGAGKTSLLHAIDRLVEDVPGARIGGRVWIDDRDAASFEVNALRRHVGLILQRPAPFPVSIRENMAFPLRAHGYAASEIPGRIEVALQRAALWEEVRDRLKESATRLSGGQQQRLCLARALALSPAALLLDEPCAALDVRSTQLVEETLAGLGGQTTLLIATHNLAQARRLAHRCAAVWPSPTGGFLADEGETERVLTAPAAELAAWLSGAVG